MTLTFTIAQHYLTVQGQLLRKNRDIDAFVYGVKFPTDKYEKDLLTALKAYSKRNR
ncbi:hypothetical protein MM221_07380 [Salipaludibacillus sp. LMS25]|uniref:hypothetical protein n=1 Tax=Salipaludibacillus sp. LMS25 TaxID=2924031 RepID=UPI0020D140B6|nr:hypothetical protein [Salipaludibacillus sp. LMS25]UTR16360.1 hypothetical protein MM221_07380 [Salipaludibacillus sp. LMS25]